MAVLHPIIPSTPQAASVTQVVLEASLPSRVRGCGRVNFLADEGVDRQIVERLRQNDHQVFYVAEFEPGTSDDVILSQANDIQAPLLTADKDFGELVHRQCLIP